MNQAANEYKDNLYSELSKIGKGLSSDRRLEILDLLSQSPKTVESLARQSGMSIANTSRHLKTLRDANLVSSTKNGNFVVYKLATKQVEQLFYLLRDVGENQLLAMKQIRQSFDISEQVKTLDLSTAVKLLSRDDVQLLDVRPKDEFQAGHIKGAINIPIDQLSNQAEKIDPQKDIIVYCRGHLCALTNQATRLLNEQGRNAYSLNESYYDWREFVAQQ
ncbi:ArsR/SmtB family transcription factor [Companilactobacillus futsaii]|uniref:Metalloregulator ArsR/SmtB family transcription factor n=2 Tax=Companilactobacillus futsaii TaxID=938155 RepID=A0A5B7T1M6_9LACO|nr:metalloregulator ArsR/SmtB family transcription factor [Companilactobacillus futsaii]KRK90749.1 ArsR family transcriptional regulator [Companilactobacillus futsaii JCM 17355]QCX25846.1 metalloregulator ArsR/SmtB family transcription factor [Companilactobacillus futsaii]